MDVRSVVAIGAHPDDIEIGAGGLLLSLAEAVPELTVHYVLLTGSAVRQDEARTAASAFLPGARLSYGLHTLPDGRLPGHWGEVKQLLHDEAAVVERSDREAGLDRSGRGAGGPDLVLCPSAHDAHQDHRLIAELATTVFRDAFLVGYEIPKWDGDLGRPNVYLPLTDEVARRKAELLNTSFPSQKHHDWWDDEVFLGLARLRGMECRSRYAEAFFCTKAVLRLS
ncbi:MAG TPA: PIG-L family deacetylase [Micromonosporaceae bacterium]